MNFADLFFLYAFLPIALLAYFIPQKIEIKNAVLIAVSLVFYAWGNPLMLILLVIYSIINFFAGLGLEKFRGTGTGKIIVAASLVMDIGLLVFYKYLGFFASNINAIFKTSLTAPRLAIPVGLSFFTFRVISYLLDVYWEKLDAEKKFSSFLLFTSFFPCTMAGPIVRYSTIGESLHERKVYLNDVYEGILRICVGLGKKVILADNLYEIVDTLMISGNVSKLTFVESWFAILAYTMYVYFDFSGYSDMAIGIARLFGFKFEENFDHPFICTSVAEFWQRWHISLGSFFRDYLLYVPIFGKMRIYGGLFLVWFCTGLWHGASWNYVIWGLYFGLFLFIETKLGKKKLKKIPIVVKHIYTKIIIILGFGIFAFEDMGKMGRFFGNLFGFSKAGFNNVLAKGFMTSNIYLMIVALICTFPIASFIKKKVQNKPVIYGALSFVWALFCIALLVISTVLLVNATSHPFLYEQY